MDGGFKYVWGSDGRDELFDLGSDPLESRDILEERPGVARRLRSTMEETWRGLPVCVPAEYDSVAAGEEPSAEQLELLRSLGYVR